MEKIKVGDYVRTKEGYIGKYIKDTSTKGVVEIKDNEITFVTLKNNITKHSPNIIDLIEEGDYVNGCLVTAIYDEYKNDNTIQFETNYEGRYRYYSDGDIKSIVTKEQFNSIAYRLEE